jgi:hypothetical protein
MCKRKRGTDMNVNIVKSEKPKQTIGQMRANNAFKLGGFWYLPICMDDDCIENYQDFWEQHAESVPGYPEPRFTNNAVPCFRVASASFVYLDPDLEVEEYGTPSLSVNIS